MPATTPSTVADLRIPLPHRAVSPRRPRPYRVRERCLATFRLEVARALGRLESSLAFGAADLVADVVIGTREARRVGPLWIPQARAEMLEIAALATEAVGDALGPGGPRIAVGEVSRSSNWGPQILVRLRSADAASPASVVAEA